MADHSKEVVAMRDIPVGPRSLRQEESARHDRSFRCRNARGIRKAMVGLVSRRRQYSVGVASRSLDDSVGAVLHGSLTLCERSVRLLALVAQTLVGLLAFTRRFGHVCHRYTRYPRAPLPDGSGAW
jgi:hypothetical protein